MALPNNNKDFSAGFSGFDTQGLVSLHSHWVGRISSRPYTSANGQFFVRIDDIRNIDLTDETRLNPDLSVIDIDYKYPNGNGTWTYGGDGAYLECQGVTIPAGQGLSFNFQFIAGDTTSRGGNDFAVILAYPNDDLTVVPKSKVFYDIRKLRKGNPRRLQTDNENWQVFNSWNPTNDATGFSGTLRWVMMNGQIRRNKSDQPTLALNARPSCLLIDFIDIV